MDIRQLQLAIVQIVCALLASLLVVAPARAQKVSFDVTTYGDFHINFIDIRTQGGLGMGVSRVYNSLDNDRTGRFGNGWSAQAETYVTVEADGSIVIHEYGGGANNAFQPTTLSRRASTDILNEIMRAAEETGKFGSDADRLAYRQWLETDDNEEYAWENFASLGLVRQQDPPIGETFFSGRFDTEFVTRVPEGYQREMKYTGGVLFQAFNFGGRLTRYWDTNHNFIALSYGQDGNIQEALDNEGDRFAFSTKNGLVARVNDAPDHLVLYDYKTSNVPYSGYDLTSVTVDGKKTRYDYDRNDRIIAIWYPDSTSMHITYDQTGKATSVKDTDGTMTTYSYTTRRTQMIDVSTFEEDIHKSNGEIQRDTFQSFYDPPDYYKDKEIETDDGVVVKTTTYNSNGDELTSTTAKGSTEYGYDSLDREILEKEPTGRTLTWQYDPATGSVSVTNETDKNSVLTEHFEYDPRGNLARAYDNDGHDFTINHDEHGRIASVSGTIHLSFQYPNGRAPNPTTVALDGVDSVGISYLPNGDVEKAQSLGGDVVVDKVRVALKTVDDLISDAGFDVVTLPATSK